MAKLPRISDAEWQVMDVLWSAPQPMTANEVVDALPDAGWSAPTIKTMLNRLVRKKALRYRVDGKRYIYFPAVVRDVCVRSETRSLVDRLFGGAIGPTLVHFVEDAKLSKAEVEQLRQMLDRKGKVTMAATLIAVFQRTLEASWQAGAVVLLALAMQMMLGRWLSPRWRCALWLIVFVRLVLPALPPSPLSFLNFQSRAAIPLAPPANRELMPQTTIRFGTISVGHSIDSITPAPPRIRSRDGIDCTTIASTLWIAIAGLLIFRQFITAARLARKISRLPSATNQRILTALNVCSQQISTVTPRAIETTLVSSPALAGLFRPTLLLPCGLADRLSPEQLRYVLLHELAHLRRHDVLTGWLVAIVTAVHWFNPLIWLAATRFRCDRELACDAVVFAQIHPSERKDYGLTILQLLTAMGAKTPAPAVGLIGSRRAVGRRIRAVTSFDPSTNHAAKYVGPLLLLAIAFGTLTGPRRITAATPLATSTTTSIDPTTETRTYDIRDLIIEIPDFTNAPDFSLIERRDNNNGGAPVAGNDRAIFYGRGDGGGKQNEKTRAELIHDTAQFIMDEVDPTSWNARGGKTGSLAETSGNFIITQTPKNLEAIEQLLQGFRDTRAVQITVECRFLTGDGIFKKLEDISKGNHWLITENLQSWPVYLSNADAQAILGAANSSPNSSVAAAPRLTLFNGQRAYVLVDRSSAFIESFKKHRATATQPAGFDPEIGLVHSGVLLDVQATASLDRKAVTVTLRPQTANLLGFTTKRLPESSPGQDLIVQIPHQDILKLQFTTSIPDGQVAIYRARLKQQPPSATQPVGQAVMLMIKPTIVIDDPNQRPKSSGRAAATTRPAA